MIQDLGPSVSGAAFAAQSRETLSYRGVDMELNLKDNTGRELRIGFNYEDLQYSRTYSAAGVVVGSSGSMGEQARMASAQESLAQGAVYQHQELSYTNMRLEVEGDLSLFEDAYGIAPTAQRIFDFAAGLAANHAHTGGDFDTAMDDIISGVNQGFEQAEALLGGLADISKQTGDLVSQMLSQFQDLGAQALPEMPSAAEMLAQLMADKDEEG